MTTEDKLFIWATIATILMFVCFAQFINASLSWDGLRQEAFKRGYAEWRHNTEGNPFFYWKDNAEKPTP